MTGTPIKGQGAVLSVGSALSGTAIAVTAATNASPAVLTAVNTFAAGDLLAAAAFNGITQLNGRAFIASPVTGTSATLKGVDSTLYGAYTSGGTLQKYTTTDIANNVSMKGFDGQAAEIATSHLLSSAGETEPGLQDFGQLTVDVQLITADAGQLYLQQMQETQAVAPFKLTLSNGAVCAFMAWVKGFSIDGIASNGIVTGEVTLRITNRPAKFA
jgi:hypothetical protein